MNNDFHRRVALSRLVPSIVKTQETLQTVFIMLAFAVLFCYWKSHISFHDYTIAVTIIVVASICSHLWSMGEYSYIESVIGKFRHPVPHTQNFLIILLVLLVAIAIYQHKIKKTSH